METTQSNRNPLERIDTELASLDSSVERHREERAKLSTEFEDLDNQKAELAERFTKIRRSLDLNRTRGRELSELQMKLRDEAKQAQSFIDKNVGHVHVELEAGGCLFRGTVKEAAKKFQMLSQDVIEAGGGSIDWTDMSVTMPTYKKPEPQPVEEPAKAEEEPAPDLVVPPVSVAEPKPLVEDNNDGANEPLVE